MKNEIKLRVEKVDWLKVINMAFNKKDWGKTFVLYTYDNITISCEMQMFNFSSNYAEFKVICSYPEDDYHREWINWTSENFYVDRQTIEQFTKHLNKTIYKLIEEINRNRLKRMAELEYQDLFIDYRDIDDDMIEKNDLTESYEAIQNIDNEEIQSSAIESLHTEILAKENLIFNSSVESYIDSNIKNENNFTKLYKIVKETEEEKK